LDWTWDLKRALEKVQPLFLASFQQPLEAHPWTEEEVKRAVEEATKAFEFVGKIAKAMESSPYY
jgi:heme oxygenase